MSEHRYADGAWWKPWYCRRCHPGWYYGTALTMPVVLALLLAVIL